MFNMNHNISFWIMSDEVWQRVLLWRGPRWGKDTSRSAQIRALVEFQSPCLSLWSTALWKRRGKREMKMLKEMLAIHDIRRVEKSAIGILLHVYTGCLTCNTWVFNLCPNRFRLSYAFKSMKSSVIRKLQHILHPWYGYQWVFCTFFYEYWYIWLLSTQVTEYLIYTWTKRNALVTAGHSL